jgi:hypothetical protein
VRKKVFAITRQAEIRHVAYRALNAPVVRLAGGDCPPEVPEVSPRRQAKRLAAG